MGDIQAPTLEAVTSQMGLAGGDPALIVGDLALSGFEDKLSAAWPQCHSRDEAAFRTMTAFYRAILQAAAREARNSC